ncbi:MAG: hypothetical protein IJ243_04680 [Prevotella sp.]|nr:hypothetical protein [Prevotella sp.]
MREENLTKCFEIFRGEISKRMASYFSLGNENLVFRKDCSECVIPLASQQMAEDMTEEFSTCLDYQVLYEKRTPDGSDYYVALYSIPYENEMVVVIMDSIQHGLIESVKVRFFDSLDTMYNHVRQLWIDSLFLKGKLLNGIEQEAELLQDFL